ncbi:hypothetical protein E3H11_44060, partial [Bradyrhizobium brasilense]|uniref:hypothetical protein n=1 Tax=Bradyrhizobium brasilense TaxID=1419277 RepID=UPI0014575604
NIDQIGGTIDIKSVAGEGASVTIKIPLTLAIVSALIVEAGGDPLGGGLQPVIGGVAHHMRQRILDQVEHLAVEPGVGAVH